MDAEESLMKDFSRDSESLSEHDDFTAGFRQSSKPPRTLPRLIPLLFILSVTLNILQTTYIAIQEPKCVSQFAKLPEREKTVIFNYATEYSGLEPNDTLRDARWNRLDFSDGMVALAHTESDAMGLPRSETFPWDRKKTVYINHAYHALHCTVLLHAWTFDTYHNKTPLVSYHHVEHCLDLLRQDIICAADDNMDATIHHASQNATLDTYITVDYQPRQCRDWSKLEAYVKAHSACYRSVNITRAGEDHGIHAEIERYTYCPEGSPYEPLIEVWKHLGQENPGNLEGEVRDWEKEREKLKAHDADLGIAR